MFTEDQLHKLRESLPYDGTKRIKAKLHRVSKHAIAEALNNPNTERLDIIEAAVLVVKEHKGHALDLVNEIEELAS